jgi:hypothetical protein
MLFFAYGGHLGRDVALVVLKHRIRAVVAVAWLFKLASYGPKRGSDEFPDVFKQSGFLGLNGCLGSQFRMGFYHALV